MITGRKRNLRRFFFFARHLGLDLSAPAAERKAAFRSASLRWHPDKFVQSFGGRLVPDEREAILQRVTQVSQAVNALMQEAPA